MRAVRAEQAIACFAVLALLAAGNALSTESLPSAKARLNQAMRSKGPRTPVLIDLEEQETQQTQAMCGNVPCAGVVRVKPATIVDPSEIAALSSSLSKLGSGTSDEVPFTPSSSSSSGSSSSILSALGSSSSSGSSSILSALGSSSSSGSSSILSALGSSLSSSFSASSGSSNSPVPAPASLSIESFSSSSTDSNIKDILNRYAPKLGSEISSSMESVQSIVDSLSVASECCKAPCAKRAPDCECANPCSDERVEAIVSEAPADPCCSAPCGKRAKTCACNNDPCATGQSSTDAVAAADFEAKLAMEQAAEDMFERIEDIDDNVRDIKRALLVRHVMTPRTVEDYAMLAATHEGSEPAFDENMQERLPKKSHERGSSESTFDPTSPTRPLGSSESSLAALFPHLSSSSAASSSSSQLPKSTAAFDAMTLARAAFSSSSAFGSSSSSSSSSSSESSRSEESSKAHESAQFDATSPTRPPAEPVAPVMPLQQQQPAMPFYPNLMPMLNVAAPAPIVLGSLGSSSSGSSSSSNGSESSESSSASPLASSIPAPLMSASFQSAMPLPLLSAILQSQSMGVPLQSAYPTALLPTAIPSLPIAQATPSSSSSSASSSSSSSSSSDSSQAPCGLSCNKLEDLVKSAANQAVEGVLSKIHDVVQQDVKQALQSTASRLSSSSSSSSASPSASSSFSSSSVQVPPPPPVPFTFPSSSSSSESSMVQSAQSALDEAAKLMKAVESSESSSRSFSSSSPSSSSLDSVTNKRVLDAIAERVAKKVEQSMESKLQSALGSISASSQSLFSTNSSNSSSSSSASSSGFSPLDAILVSTQETIRATAQTQAQAQVGAGAKADLALERVLRPDQFKRDRRTPQSRIQSLQKALKAAREAALFKRDADAAARQDEEEGW